MIMVRIRSTSAFVSWLLLIMIAGIVIHPNVDLPPTITTPVLFHFGAFHSGAALHKACFTGARLSTPDLDMNPVLLVWVDKALIRSSASFSVDFGRILRC
jgi:hypothetical protein